ncbi:hypothetical protein C6Q35_11080 [Burkholderia multivorans]|nr:hypothetical protein C6Q35_11080 [Burkholderia multivorans]
MGGRDASDNPCHGLCAPSRCSNADRRLDGPAEWMRVCGVRVATVAADGARSACRRSPLPPDVRFRSDEQRIRWPARSPATALTLLTRPKLPIAHRRHPVGVNPWF